VNKGSILAESVLWVRLDSIFTLLPWKRVPRRPSQDIYRHWSCRMMETVSGFPLPRSRLVIVVTFVVAKMQRFLNKNVTAHFCACHGNLARPDFT
jgi:hypothetical protein